ncbi:hypothetical protein BT63DRAFT_442729 [Microthyrium microscopicum]|uniref:Uncharacterized protein n=1 Tax=Microthyrium microscopicum TaxID=703497 RepID=A0A6A6TZ03_9PEZI|nr:hypothetical protein BT63DRAFT_442729 [Microthyrium microscopicum]
MAVSPSSPGTRPNRRSFPNLTHLSLAPLSSRFPIDDDGYDEELDQVPRSSYIQGRSAPTTPGILSRTPKKKNRAKKTATYAHESYFPPQQRSHDAPITKAKSASIITDSHAKSSLGLSALPTGPTSPLYRRTLSKPSIQSNDEWLHRAGLVIASEMREGKGQSWLVSRESSTSLVPSQEDADETYQREQREREVLVENFHSRAASRQTSRAGSRVASAKTSRRPSRVGSKVDFVGLTDSRAMTSRAVEGYFDELDVEPDFVDKEGEDELEDAAEVERLSKISTFGLGGLVDRLIGWPLFNVEEPSDSEEEEQESGTPEDVKERKAELLRRRKEQMERTANSSASATNPIPVTEPPLQEEEGGWKDAAWLFSVASKVVFSQNVAVMAQSLCNSNIWEESAMLATLPNNDSEVDDDLFGTSSIIHINLQFNRESPTYNIKNVSKKQRCTISPADVAPPESFESVALRAINIDVQLVSANGSELPEDWVEEVASSSPIYGYDTLDEIRQDNRDPFLESGAWVDDSSPIIVESDDEFEFEALIDSTASSCPVSLESSQTDVSLFDEPQVSRELDGEIPKEEHVVHEHFLLIEGLIQVLLHGSSDPSSQVIVTENSMASSLRELVPSIFSPRFLANIATRIPLMQTIARSLSSTSLNQRIQSPSLKYKLSLLADPSRAPQNDEKEGEPDVKTRNALVYHRLWKLLTPQRDVRQSETLMSVGPKRRKRNVMSRQTNDLEDMDIEMEMAYVEDLEEENSNVRRRETGCVKFLALGLQTLNMRSTIDHRADSLPRD